MTRRSVTNRREIRTDDGRILRPTKSPRIYEKISRITIRECKDCPNFHGGAPWYEATWCDATERHRNPAKDMVNELIPFWCPLPFSTGQKDELSENWEMVPIQSDYTKRREKAFGERK